MTFPWLSTIVFLPLAAAVVTVLLPANQPRLIRTWATLASLGVDGVSVLLVLLTVVLTAVAVIGAYSAVEKRAREFYACLLALEAGMLGTFLATDLVLFYFFWEAMLIPMYLLIGVWGGPRRIYASVKFIIYTIVGSVLMLAAILYCGLHERTFDVMELSSQLPDSRSITDPGLRHLLFLAF